MSDDATITHAGVPPADPTATVGLLPSPSVTPPASVPGYRLARELGRGGMGVVYLATQDGLNREVALKMVLSGEHASAMEKGRFLAEAEAVAAVRHPGVVQVFDFGTHDGRPYFALEYLSGGSLADRLKGTPLTAKAAAKLVEAVARAVQAAHDAGVIHRDLKPANILFDTDDMPKVTDFGLARKGDSGLTATGAILGTPSYMAPEQAQGLKAVGPPADVYALGAVLYECLTGRPPFRSASPLETIGQVLKDEPVPPSRLTPKLPRDVETICLKCLSKDPRKRYTSAGALADELTRYLSGEPILARPVSAAECGWRWVKRNPLLATVVVGGPVLLMGTLVAVLVALLTTATANVGLAAERVKAENQRVEAEQQRAEADRQKTLAHARLEKAIEAVDTMLTRVGSERWATNPALQAERQQVLEEAVAFLNGFTAEDATDPQVRRESAKAYMRLSVTYLMLGETKKSADAAAAACRLYDGLMAEFPDEPQYSAGASEAYAYAGSAAALQLQYPNALREYTRAVELADIARSKSPDSPVYKLRAVEARSWIGYFYLKDDRAKGAAVVGQLLELAREIGGPSDARYEYRAALAFALTVGATYDQSGGHLKVASAKYDEAAGVLDAIAGQPATTSRALAQFASTRATVTFQRGFILAQSPAADRKREGAKQMRAGLGLYEDLLRVNPNASPFLVHKFQALRLLAAVHASLNEPAEAASYTAVADKLIDELTPENPSLNMLKSIDASRISVRLTERVRVDDSLAFEVEAAQLLATSREGRQWGVMYNVACLYAVAAGKRSADKHAATAVEILNELAEADFFQPPARAAHMRSDTDLKPLEKRADFIAFLERVKNGPADLPKPK